MVLKIADISRSTRMDIPSPSHLHQRSSRSVTNAVSVLYPSLEWVQIICFLQAPLQELSNHFFSNLHYKAKVKKLDNNYPEEKNPAMVSLKKAGLPPSSSQKDHPLLKDGNTTTWTQPNDSGHWTQQISDQIYNSVKVVNLTGSHRINFSPDKAIRLCLGNSIRFAQSPNLCEFTDQAA